MSWSKCAHYSARSPRASNPASAASCYAAPFVREVLAYETPSSTEWGTPDVHGAFVPDVYVDISETLEAKVRAFACYEREVREAPHPRSSASLRARAATWGSVIGVAAAEPLHVVRIVR